MPSERGSTWAAKFTPRTTNHRPPGRQTDLTLFTSASDMPQCGRRLSAPIPADGTIALQHYRTTYRGMGTRNIDMWS